MANKYIIHGATYCGDGTSSAVAFSNGGVGAWNDINVFEGIAPAYGTAPAAGDTVYIRSKTSAGADITRTLAAAISLGSAAATVNNPIYFILDQGIIWSGITGTLTYQAGTSSYSVTIRAYNIIDGTTQDALVIKNTATNPGDWEYLTIVNGWLKHAFLDWSAKTGAYGAMIRINDGGVLESPHIKWGRLAPYDFLISHYTQSGKCALINPDIELTNSIAYGQAIFGMTSNGYSFDIDVIGGQVRGVGSTASGQSLIKISPWDNSHLFRFVDFNVPKEMAVTNTAITTARVRIEMTASDSTLGGHIEGLWGYATSRTDNNPPYLSAALPDTASTGWAWRLWPRSASVIHPVRLPSLKFFTESAAAKTITLNLLAANTITTSKKDMFVVVEYVDNSTGLHKSVSSFDVVGGTLDTSTANWSAIVWGMVSFNKHSIQVTTPTSIKQNTPIMVTLVCTKNFTSSSDIFFIDPDFLLS